MELLKPMLAKTYDPERHIPTKDEPMFVQPKLDGIRCQAYLSVSEGVKLISRKENEFHLPDIQVALLALFKKLPNTIFFDGELYCHGKTFDEISSSVKNRSNPNHQGLKYFIYDRRTPVNGDFSIRTVNIHTKMMELRPYHQNYLISCETFMVTNSKEYDIIHAQ